MTPIISGEKAAFEKSFIVNPAAANRSQSEFQLRTKRRKRFLFPALEHFPLSRHFSRAVAFAGLTLSYVSAALATNAIRSPSLGRCHPCITKCVRRTTIKMAMKKYDINGNSFGGHFSHPLPSQNRATVMPLSLTDVLLSPVERPDCARCRSTMNLTVITPSSDSCEKLLFECPKCRLIETRIVTEPITLKTQFGSHEIAQ